MKKILAYKLKVDGKINIEKGNQVDSFLQQYPLEHTSRGRTI